MAADVILNRFYLLLQVTERAAAQALLGQISQPSLDQIQTRKGRRREVQVKARPASEPTLDRRMLVGRDMTTLRI